MYFWKIESLKEDFSSGSFTDRELIPYVVLYAGLYAIGIELMGYLPYEDINVWTYVSSVMNILIPVVGTIYAYKMNGGGGGSNFASKYFSIGFVVSVRFMVYLIPVIILMFIYWEITYRETEDMHMSVVEVFLFSSWYVFLYLRMAKHIGDTAHA